MFTEKERLERALRQEEVDRSAMYLCLGKDEYDHDRSHGCL